LRIAVTYSKKSDAEVTLGCYKIRKKHKPKSILLTGEGLS
jgi:hypothetical protein